MASFDQSPFSGARADDPALALLVAEPFRIHRPVRQTVPFVFASPHSGRLYPPGFVRQSPLDAVTLRRSEDAFVDELFAAVPMLGAPLIAARFPRAYCDANRAPTELDPAMFSGTLSVPHDPPSPRVAAGLGVIPRIVRDGADIYRGKLAPDEAAKRLFHLHGPYHAALAALVAETQRCFGLAIVMDCHSMPSALAVPDIVLGDRYGACAPAGLTAWAEDAFAAARFSVARNAPYAGGYTTVLYGRPAGGCHSLQIEINRSLYLQEESLARRPAFESVQRRLSAVLAKLVDFPAGMLIRHDVPPLAAE